MLKLKVIKTFQFFLKFVTLKTNFIFYLNYNKFWGFKKLKPNKNAELQNN